MLPGRGTTRTFGLGRTFYLFTNLLFVSTASPSDDTDKQFAPNTEYPLLQPTRRLFLPLVVFWCCWWHAVDAAKMVFCRVGCPFVGFPL